VRKVKVEVRQVEDGISMVDESNSAHQFSVRDVEIQPPILVENEMQTTPIEYAEREDQTSL
jgi:hypothetical protein